MTYKIKSKWYYLKAKYKLLRFQRSLKPKTPLKVHSKRAVSFGLVAIFLLTNMTFLNMINFGGRASAGTPASAGPNTAAATGDCTNDTGIGTLEWTTPGQAFSNNANYASRGVDGTVSNYIKCVNFGFSIPASARIDGITVGVERKSSATANGGSQDAAMRIVKNNVIGSTDRSTATTYTLADVFENHGGASDLWGESWDPSDVNLANFGAAFAVTKADPTGAAHTVTVDTIRITINYTTFSPINQAAYRFYDNADTASTSGNFTKLPNPDTAPNGNVNATAYSPDGSYMGLATSTSPYVNIYKVEDSTDVHTKLSDPTAANGVANDIAFSPSGQYMAVADSTAPYISIYEINPATDTFTKLSAPANVPNGVANGVSFSPNGQYLSIAHDGSSEYGLVYEITSSTDTFTKISSGNFTAAIPGASTATSFSPDGNYLSFSHTGGVRLSNYAVNTTTDTFTKLANPGTTPGSATSSISYSPDSLYMGVTMASSPYFFVYSVDSSTDTYTKIANPISLPTNAGSDISFNYNAGLVAISTTTSPYLILYSLNTTTDVLTKLSDPGTMPTGQGNGVEFSPNNRNLSVAHNTSPYVSIYKVDNSVDVGAPLAALNTAATIPAEGEPFRLRFNLAVTVIDLLPGEYNLKLQYAKKSGTCDTGFSGEVFSDISSSSAISYYTDNQVISDHMTAASNANDPTNPGNTNIMQEFQESGTFTVSTAITATDNGVWDVALKDNGADANTDYCLRTVLSNGTPLDTYTVVPQITTIDAPFAQAGYRWFENSDTPIDNTVAVGFGGTRNSVFLDVAQTTDGGYVAVGEIWETDNSSKDQLIVKFNVLGEVEWSRTWGLGGLADQASSVVITPDGNLVVVGVTYSYGAGFGDMSIVKFSNIGTEMWSKTWGGTEPETAYDVIVTSDGGLMVVGDTSTFALGGIGFQDAALVKLTADGVEQWSKAWNGPAGNSGYQDRAVGIVETSAGDYVMAANTYQFGGCHCAALASFNSSGVEQWSKTIGDSGGPAGFLEVESLVNTSDGGFVIAGYTDQIGSGNHDWLISKFNSTGIEQWTKTFSSTSTVSSVTDVIELADSSLLLTGYMAADGSRIVNLNSSGIEQWSKDINITTNGNGYATIQTNDGGLVSVGSIGDNNFLDSATLYKTTVDGDISNCSQCVTVNQSETNQTIAETNRTITELDIVISESDHATSEVNLVNQQYTVYCGDRDNDAFIVGWGGAGGDVARAITNTSDGGYVVVGDTNSFSGSYDMSVVKFNSLGVEQWSKTWGNTGVDVAQGVTEASDGSIIVVGYTTSYGAGAEDQVIVKFNSTGVEQWSKTWGNTGGDVARSVQETSDGGFIVAGDTSSYGAGDYDMSLVKYNSSGIEQWSKTWGGASADAANSVYETSDNGFVAAGWTNSHGAGGTDIALVKFNSSGIEQWSKTWGAGSSDLAQSVIESSTGSLIVAGYTSSYGAGGWDQVLINFNSSGVEQWSKTWGGVNDDISRSVAELSDGSFVTTGNTLNFGLGGQDQTLVIYNSSGVELATKTWGGQFVDDANGLAVNSLDKITVTGYSTTIEASGDQTLFTYDYANDLCTELCTTQTMTEANVTITESNIVKTEGNVTITEANVTITEGNANTDEYNVDSILIPASGSALSDTNTVPTIARNDLPVRLRYLLGATSNGKTVGAGSLTLKLQFAAKIGTCDTLFSGESYADVSGSTLFSFYTNSILQDGDVTGNYSNDPMYNSLGNVVQSYESSGTMTNSTPLYAQTNALWDISLTPNLATNGSYCFRVVYSSGTLLDTYTYIPEITIPPNTKQFMRHNAFFDAENGSEGTKQAFYW